MPSGRAATEQTGGYSGVPTRVVTMLQAQAKVGCAWRWCMPKDDVKLAKPEENRARIAEAVKIAQSADAVVLFVGGNASISRETWDYKHMGDALIEGWYLGQEGGTAIADILFGDANPGGKLPVTITRSVGQLPMFYNQKPSAYRGYIFDVTEPLFPFGFGLS